MTPLKDFDFCSTYLAWLKENIDQYRVSDTTFRITLPFLDSSNDFIEVYIIQKDDGTFMITDGGTTINNLELNGLDFKSSRRKKDILKSIVAAHGITLLNDNSLTVNCALSDLPLKKHLLSQCMIKVSDMFYLSRSNVQSIFLEEVQKFFDDNDVRAVPNISLTGKSKLTTHFDFAIAKSKNAPERLIRVVNKLDNTVAKSIIFAWNDTKQERDNNSQLYTIIQDTDKKVSEDALSALKEYGINTTLWSEKDKYTQTFVA